MERVQVLIDKLVQQKKDKESAAQLLFTVQQLQQELLQQQQTIATSASKKVSVIMPAFARPQTEAEETAAPVPVKKEPEVQKVAEVPKEVLPVAENFSIKKPSISFVMEEKGEVKEAPKPVIKPVTPQHHYLFDTGEEAPTLLQHTPQEEKKIHKEINQIIHGEQRSLNDQLKQTKTEIAHLLQETPIKDLRKAIGINDKFVFLNELFNGDEVMYERSIKTINNFHVLQEAEYWMNRELKLRLGWNDTKSSVQHFYSLVRRRFS